MPIKLSLIIPARSTSDPKLRELRRSIDAQTFPKDQMETLVITEGTSESAKAIGIRRAKGYVVGILASDNELIQRDFLSEMYKNALYHGAAYPLKYHYAKDDDVLNRYFALIGGNDPLSFYMGKNDRASYLPLGFNLCGSIGDNGYFVRKDLIEKTDLDNYYHVDNALECGAQTVAMPYTIWHKTGGNLLSFLAKRYSYGLQHAFNNNRRWHLVDFSKSGDVWKLAVFILSTLTIMPTLFLSIRGYLKVRDVAWFMHPLICILTLFTYALLIFHLSLRKMSLLLSAPMVAQRA